MKSVLFILLYLVSNFFNLDVLAAQTSRSCDQWTDFISFSSQSSLDSESIRNLGASIKLINPVTMVGENHDNMTWKKATTPFITGLLDRNPEVDCIFFELENRNEWLAVVEESISKHLDVRAVYKKSLIGENTWFVPTEEQIMLLLPWLELAKIANEKGIKYFFYDELSGHSLTKRNKVMSERILREHRGGQCHKSVALNGIVHLTANSLAGDVLAMPTILKSSNMPVQRILIREHASLRQDFGRGLEKCMNFPASPFAFKPEILKAPYSRIQLNLKAESESNMGVPALKIDKITEGDLFLYF